MTKLTNDEEKVNTLIYCMGYKAEDIMLTFGLSEAQKKAYKTVKEKFDTHL